MSSQEDLQTAVNRVHKALIDTTTTIIQQLTNQTGFNSYAVKWVEYANQLHRLVPDFAVPAWLSDVADTFGPTFNGNVQHFELAQYVVFNAPDIREPILVDAAATLDIEELFANQLHKYKLDDIFETLVSCLGELISADVIDNRTVHEAILRLQAMLRRSRNGSFATVMMTMNYGRFVVTSFYDLLRANKYAKPFIDNFKREFTTASKIVEQAEQATKQEVVSRLTNVKRIEMLIDSNPDIETKISGFLPPAETADDGNQEP